MRAAIIEETWGSDNLRVVERATPQPAAGEVLMSVRRASLNYRDWLMVEGHYNPRQPLPLIPGSDGAGVVEACGEGVTRFAPGDRVIASFFRDWVSGEPTRDRLKSSVGGPNDGLLADSYCAPEHAFVATPEHLSDDEAATLPCAAVTAWNALVTQGGLRAGQTVLVLGTGGVSMFALQFARMHGARVIATSSSDEKLDVLRKEHGVHDLINYVEQPKWGRAVRELVPEGVDHVVEVGGAGTLQQSIRAVRPGGRIHLIGVLAGGASPVNLVPILMQNIRIQGVIVGPTDTFEAMNRAISVGELHPRIDTTFTLSEIQRAFDHLHSAQHLGKIVIDCTS